METIKNKNEEKQESFLPQFPKKKGSPGTNEYLYETIREMNGFTEKEIQNPSNIERIEVVLDELYVMKGISAFKNLKSLSLINVNLRKIEDLNDLKSLEDLWLNENYISIIEGLSDCINLKSLYLSYNQIKKIQNLEKLTKLENLWLCNNQIEKIENLEKLENLKQFWVASNQIESIKDSLDSLKNLIDLNVSANKLSTFKEVLYLNKLQYLQSLSFYDPHFGENPICNLCNYQTFVLYHLRNITKLDTLLISEDAKSFAEATFMKKKMYYNMRIKTIQRIFSSLNKLIKTAKEIKINTINLEISNFESKSVSIQDNYLIKQKYDQIIFEEKNYEGFKLKLREIASQSIHRLVTELETGGNIRLEDGKGNEKWYISCVDLIKSRFNPEEMANYDIIDINIKNVTRIHNRFLRIKFEEKMESLVDISAPSYKKSLEYLFYGVDPKYPNEIFHIIEEGFRSGGEALKNGISPYPILVNSILSADAPRISNYFKNNKNNSKILPKGYLIICKALILKSTLDSKFPNFDLNKSRNDIFLDNKFEISKDDFSIFRMNDNDEKHKLWFISDNNLVLPEYLIEFQYITKQEFTNNKICFSENSYCELIDKNKDNEFITPFTIDKFKDKLNNIFNDYSKNISDEYNKKNKNKSKDMLILTANDLDRCELENVKILCCNYFKYNLSCPENKFEDSKNLNLSIQLMEKKNNLSEIISLNLSNSNIENLDSSIFSYLNNLEYLNLSFNKIKIIEILQNCIKINGLNISYNLLINFNLSNLANLEKLNISHNIIDNLNTFEILIHNKKLNNLNIRGNLLYNQNKETKIFNKIIQILPDLQIYNNREIKNTNFKIFNEKTEIFINDDIIYENSEFIQNLKIDKKLDWKPNIIYLNLRHQKLEILNNVLLSLTSLKRLDLGHNLIKKIEGLENCKLLEELNLEKNSLLKIEGINTLQYLKKLELGSNKISLIEGLNNLDNLIQLSLEDNEIFTLSNFPILKTLMEMYLSNNNLSNCKEIQNLNHLNKLIILDFSGNIMSNDPNYRIYTLYVVKKLKVLDGIAVELSEHQAAKDLFTGRLTEEILLQRLNGLSPNDVRELDLSNCKLKDFEDIFNENYFPNLEELNLSGNYFTGIKMLGFLPKLKIIVLNSNKIESLFINNDINSKIGLNGCQEIEILDISYNILKDLNGLQLAILKNLKVLKADHNEINKIDCLDNLEQIKEIDLNNNRIRQFDLNSFSMTCPLKCLKIEDNSLKNFQNIQKLLKLQHLFASNNRINDLPDIEKLIDLISLRELELNGNSISKRPGYRQAIIKKLSNLLYLDGKEITAEEREKIEMTVNGIPPEKSIVPNFYNTNANSKIPVKLSSINFDGVFGNVRFPSEIIKK